MLLCSCEYFSTRICVSSSKSGVRLLGFVSMIDHSFTAALVCYLSSVTSRSGDFGCCASKSPSFHFFLLSIT